MRRGAPATDCGTIRRLRGWRMRLRTGRRRPSWYELGSDGRSRRRRPKADAAVAGPRGCSLQTPLYADGRTASRAATANQRAGGRCPCRAPGERGFHGCSWRPRLALSVTSRETVMFPRVRRKPERGTDGCVHGSRELSGALTHAIYCATLSPNQDGACLATALLARSSHLGWPSRWGRAQAYPGPSARR